MAKLKETEINENIIESLSAEGGDKTGAESGAGDKNTELDIIKDEGEKGDESSLKDKICSDEVPDYADKILKMYPDRESLFIGPFGETHESSCNIKEVREQFALYKNKHYNKK